MKLYAARDKNTGKLVSDISSSRCKFWSREGNCRTAIKKYNSNHLWENDSYNLEIVEFELVEKDIVKVWNSRYS